MAAITSLLDRTRERMSGQTETATFLGLALLVGVLVGAAAALLIEAISGVTALIEWVGHLLGIDRWVLLVALPLGLLGAWWIGHRFAPEVSGDGVPEATIGLALRAGYLPSRAVPLKIVATALTLGSGGSAGREGPIVQIGATIGSSVARRMHMGEDQIRSLVAAGAGAAIGASFNAPIAGMLFAMEVLLRAFSVRHLSAVVVASVAAAVTNERLVGPDRLLAAPKIYSVLDARELGLYAAIGIIAALAGFALLKTLHWTEDLGERIRRHAWLRPLAMGLAVAAIGIFEPGVLGTGQEFVSEVLGFDTLGSEVWWVLVVLAVLKIVATSLTIGSGASGGAFFPSLFIGATLGAAFGELVGPVWSISPIRPGAFAIVGMAATFAAVARAPLTSILIVFEITQDYGLVLPLMLAVVLASFLTDLVHPESVYTMPLARRGVKLVRSSEVDVLDTVSVGEVMSHNPLTVRSEDTVLHVQEILDAGRRHGAAVLDGDDRLVGMVGISDVLRARDRRHVPISDVMTRRPVTVSPGTPASVALARMAALGIGRLPVVAEDDMARLVGMFRREDAVRAYHQALSTRTDHELARRRLRERTDPGAVYFDFRVPPGSMADGKLLKQVSWPEGCTLVSVRRGRAVYVPTGNTILEHNDVVTAFGTPAARAALIERLNATADEPTAEIPITEE